MEKRCTLLLTVVVVLGVGHATNLAHAQGTAKVQVLADSGFRPKPDGFSFENWGGQDHPASRLTAADAEYLFGDQVCARRSNEVCIPTPGARMWIEEMNKSTEGGHCEGMAALSAAFFVKGESPRTFGAPQAFSLSARDGVLLRTISTYYTTQALEPVQSAVSATREWSLQKIVDSLVQGLKSGSDYPTLGIYDTSGGHAVTPYKITSDGRGIYRIYIYDNNYPGAEKFIDVDVPRDHWIYSGAALNPKEDPAAWQGGAGSMDVTLLSKRYEPLQCPFCGDRKAPASGSSSPRPNPVRPKAPTRTPNRPVRAPATAPDSYTVYTSSRCSQVQAVNRNNQQTVRIGANGIDNQISGATMRPLRGSRGCVVRLPNDQQYDVRLVDDGRGVAQSMAQLTVFTPGKVYSVSDVALRPGATETFSVSQGDFSYQAGGRQSPKLRVGSDGDGANGYYEVSGFDLNQGREFGARDTGDGEIAFNNDDPAIDDFDLRAQVVDESASKIYEFVDVDIGDNGQALVDVEDDGDLDLDIDSDSDGESDEADDDDDNDGTVDLSDQDDDNDGLTDDDDIAYNTDSDSADAAAEDLDLDEAEYSDEGADGGADETDASDDAEQASEEAAQDSSAADEAEAADTGDTEDEVADADEEGGVTAKASDAPESSDDADEPENADAEEGVEPETDEAVEAEEPEVDEADEPETDEADEPETDEPEVDEADEPEADEADEPEADEADEPEVDEADEPEADEADEPEVEEADEPEVEEADEPEVEEADEPEVEEADEPEVDEADEPEVDEADEPEVDEADEPEVDEADESELEAADEADEDGKFDSDE